MSRGPGRLQRYIVETLDHTAEDSEYGPPVRLWPVLALAQRYWVTSGDSYPDFGDELYLRSAFRRAAHSLIKGGLIKGWRIRMKTAVDLGGLTIAPASLLCVARPDVAELTREDIRAAELVVAYSMSSGEEDLSKLIRGVRESERYWAEQATQCGDAPRSYT